MSYRVRLIAAVVVSAIILIIWQLVLHKTKPEEEAIIEEHPDTSMQITHVDPILTTSQHPEIPESLLFEPDTLIFELTLEDSSPFILKNNDIELEIDLLHGASISQVKLLNYNITREDAPLLLYPLDEDKRGMLFYIIKNEDKEIFLSTREIPMILDSVYRIFDTTVVIFTQKVGQHQLGIRYELPDEGFTLKTSFWSEGVNKRFYSGFMIWEDGIAITEPDLPIDPGKRRFLVAMSHVGYSHWRKSLKDIKNGTTYDELAHWAGISNQYFLAAFIPRGERDSDFSVNVNFNIPEDSLHDYSVDIEFGPIKLDTLKFISYLGPLDETSLGSVGYHLDENVEMGWRWLRPISKVILWLLRFLNSFISNFGLVIIVFALIMTLAFSPLTLYSQKSMRKMQEIQPKLEEVKKKYKSDPQRLNKETIKLYKEEAFNPFSGCLPLLLQMPVFMALYQIMRTTIVLRGQGFLWIPDLSRPESTIPFSLPFSSAPGIGILPILMGVMMFFQQKMTNPNPQQKAMTWIMPIFMTYLFISFPSAIVLYWTAYNTFGLILQLIVRYKSKKTISDKE